MNMKAIKTMILLAALTTAWGCSDDDDPKNSPKWDGSVFVESASPDWSVNWTWNDAEPDWQEPDPEKYECPMYLLVEIDEGMTSYSSDNDKMGVFIDGECRGVSSRNVNPFSGKVSYLLHVKGSSEETYLPVELRYYCDRMHQLFIPPFVIPFNPNNLMDNTEIIMLDLGEGSTKYPVWSVINAVLPNQLPFTLSSGDKMAVFVGEECRGIGQRDAVNPLMWTINAFGAVKGETAELRYYSANMGGTYIILKKITLNGGVIEEHLSF